MCFQNKILINTLIITPVDCFPWYLTIVSCRLLSLLEIYEITSNFWWIRACVVFQFRQPGYCQCLTFPWNPQCSHAYPVLSSTIPPINFSSKCKSVLVSPVLRVNLSCINLCNPDIDGVDLIFFNKNFSAFFSLSYLVKYSVSAKTKRISSTESNVSTRKSQYSSSSFKTLKLL